MNLVQDFVNKETIADPPNRYVEIIHSPKWVRVSFGGEFIADSKNVILLRQKGRTPVYYIPQRDVRLEFLEETGRTGKFPGLGKTSLLTVRVGSRVAENAAWYYPFPFPEVGKIQNLVAFYPQKVDAIYVDGIK